MMQLQYYSEVMPDLSPRFRALIIISTYNWILTTYKTMSQWIEQGWSTK